MSNSKTKKRWNNNANRTMLNKNKPKQATNSTTTSIAPNTYSAPPTGPMYRLSSQRRKISNHPDNGPTTTARPFTYLKDVADDKPTMRGRLGKRAEAWTTRKKEHEPTTHHRGNCQPPPGSEPNQPTQTPPNAPVALWKSV